MCFLVDLFFLIELFFLIDFLHEAAPCIYDLIFKIYRPKGYLIIYSSGRHSKVGQNQTCQILLRCVSGSNLIIVSKFF